MLFVPQISAIFQCSWHLPEADFSRPQLTYRRPTHFDFVQRPLLLSTHRLKVSFCWFEPVVVKSTVLQ